MNWTIEKMVRVPGTMLKERMHIKSFKTGHNMHGFLSKQSDNRWTESKHNLKTGVYAYAGGTWHNVKSLDSCALAHI